MPASPRQPWLDWLPLVGLAITIAGMIWAGATYAGQLNDNTRRIQALEASDQKRTDTLNSVDVRTAKIEGILEEMRDGKSNRHD